MSERSVIVVCGAPSSTIIVTVLSELADHMFTCLRDFVCVMESELRLVIYAQVFCWAQPGVFGFSSRSSFSICEVLDTSTFDELV